MNTFPVKTTFYDVFDMIQYVLFFSNNCTISYVITYVENELLYQFEFPDVAGSLGHFLDTMKRVNSKQWNITLFHYRKTGYPSSSVLVGFQVKEKDNIFFKIFLNQLGYSNEQVSKL